MAPMPKLFGNIPTIWVLWAPTPSQQMTIVSYGNQPDCGDLQELWAASSQQPVRSLLLGKVVRKAIATESSIPWRAYQTVSNIYDDSSQGGDNIIRYVTRRTSNKKNPHGVGYHGFSLGDIHGHLVSQEMDPSAVWMGLLGDAEASGSKAERSFPGRTPRSQVTPKEQQVTSRKGLGK